MATKRATKSGKKVKSLTVKSVSNKNARSVRGGHDDESPKKTRA